jgi:hypothetical protein
MFVYQLISTTKNNLLLIEKKIGFNDPDKTLLINLCKAIIGFVLMRLLLGLFGMDLYEIYWWVALGLILSIRKLIQQSN